MNAITCTVEEAELEDENGFDVPGVIVTCGRCGHSEESFGTSERSVRRCLVLLRENCPEGEQFFYEPEAGE